MTTDTRDHYEVLGLAPDASIVDIQNAYRRAVMASHPDREGGSETAIKRVQEAYNCLKDSRKRAAYDLGVRDSDAELQEQAEGALEIMLAELIDSACEDIPSYLRSRGVNIIEMKETEMRRLTRTIGRLENKRRRFAFKGDGTNIFDHVLCTKITKANEEFVDAVRTIEVSRRVITMLDEYQDLGALAEFPTALTHTPMKLPAPGEQEPV